MAACGLHQAVLEHEAPLELRPPQIEVPMAKAQLFGRQALALTASDRDDRHESRPDNLD